MKKMNKKVVAIAVSVVAVICVVTFCLNHFTALNHVINVLEDEGYNVTVTYEGEAVNGDNYAEIYVSDADVTVAIVYKGTKLEVVQVSGELNWNSSEETLSNGVQPFWTILIDELEADEVSMIDAEVTKGDTKVVSEHGVTEWGIDFANGEYWIEFATHELSVKY